MSSATKKKTIKKSGAAASQAPTYGITLRELGGTALQFLAQDRVLYPVAVSWNRILTSDLGRQADERNENMSWRGHAKEALFDLSRQAQLDPAETEKFILAAAKSGLVQVEIPWTEESVGWAARLFPWEAILALATKAARSQIGQQRFLVVRFLHQGTTSKSPTPIKLTEAQFLVHALAAEDGRELNTEHKAVCAGLYPTEVERKTIHDLTTQSVSNTGLVHIVLNSDRLSEANNPSDANKKSSDELGKETVAIAQAIAKEHPQLVTFSDSYSGRRLAPLTVAYGAQAALGFLNAVEDSSIPVFVGAFYRALVRGQSYVEAMHAGLQANRLLANPSDLGTVSLWSASDLLSNVTRPKAKKASPEKVPPLKWEDLLHALPVICDPEDELNYSVLYHSRGGVFKRLMITKVQEGALPAPLEVTVRLDTGLDRTAECHFFASFDGAGAPRQIDLAARVTLPLGSQLLRQRGETMLGTLAVEIKCGEHQVFHCFRSIKLLPCDEWRDRKESGRHLLPAFIFPRDPTVRSILSEAQPFLRAICDSPQAPFAGYQASTATVEQQARSIWAVLQHSWALDYSNPPPTYSYSSQRLRIPEEIHRARRGTCIELTLLFASCLEHIGIHPTIFLIAGHAYMGFWTAEEHHEGFINSLEDFLKHAKPDSSEAAQWKKSDELYRCKDVSEPWMLAEPHHLRAIQQQVMRGHLTPLETTFIPLKHSFADAVKDAQQRTAGLSPAEFDGMLDVKTARQKGVTPLPIITVSPVA